MSKARIRLTGAELAKALGKKDKRVMPSGKRKVVAPPPVPEEAGTHEGKADTRPVFDSEDEVIYADLLEAMKSRKEILRWDYQPERFRLGNGAWYTPDFRVVMPDQAVRFIEIKGFQREAALVRLKVAATLHPYRFIMIRREPLKLGGRWQTIWDSHAKTVR